MKSEVVSGDSDCKEVVYERTPIMSTYLLAFVVGEYDFVEGQDSDGVKVRVYTPVGKAQQGDFALEVIILLLYLLLLFVVTIWPFVWKRPFK